MVEHRAGHLDNQDTKQVSQLVSKRGYREFGRESMMRENSTKIEIFDNFGGVAQSVEQRTFNP
jgi:hypothetical protein